LLFGAIPLLRSRDMTAALQESGRGNTASRRRHRARHLLMGAQVALALVLLVSSGLMVRSFQKLRAVNPGYDASSALTFSIGLPEREYATQQAAIAAHHTIVERLQALPGVVRVSATSCLPLSAACYGNTLRVEGRPWDPNTVPPIAVFRAVAGGYFEAMGMPILRGRPLDRSDVDRKERVAVVSNALAKRYFPDQDPIGRRIASNRPPKAPGLSADLIWLTIVGIVPDSPTGRLLPEPNPLPQVFMPLSIAGGPGIPRNALIGPDISVMSYVVRTATPPLDVLESVRSAITAFDANLPLAQERTLQDTLDRASAQMAFTMILLVIASAVALLLGTIGIYGVMSYGVAQRTAEIGVRLALGADPAGVAGEIIRQGGVVTLAGIVAGLGAALAGGRLLESLLYGVSARDPIVLIATTLALLAVALVACWLPARRAARLSPVDALRS
jgi:putative ABC transport system permease protein